MHDSLGLQFLWLPDYYLKSHNIHVPSVLELIKLLLSGETCNDVIGPLCSFRTCNKCRNSDFAFHIRT